HPSGDASPPFVLVARATSCGEGHPPADLALLRRARAWGPDHRRTGVHRRRVEGGAALRAGNRRLLPRELRVERLGAPQRGAHARQLWPVPAVARLHLHTFHAMHHARYTGHYGLFTTVLDRVLGTAWDDTPEVQARAARG